MWLLRETSTRNMELDLKIASLLGFGCFKKEIPRSRWLTLLRYIPLVQWSLQVLILQPMNMVTNWGNTIEAVSSMVAIIFYTFVAVICETWHYRRADIRQLVDDLHAMEDSQHLHDEYARSVQQKANRFTRILAQGSLAFLVFLSGIIIPLGTIFVTYPKRKYLHSLWLPYNGTSTPQYQLTYFPLTIMLEISAFDIVVVLFALISLTVHCIAQLYILCHNLENVRKHATALVTADKDRWGQRTMTDHETTFRSLLEATNPNSVGASSSAGYDTLTTTRVNFADEIRGTRVCNASGDRLNALHPFETKTERDDDIDDVMARLLNKCVVHHRELLGFIAEMESIFDPILYAGVMINYMLLGLTLMFLQVVDEFEILAVLLLILNTMTMTILFIVVWTMDKISEQCSLVRDAAYACDWLDSPASFKRTLRIIMCRANSETVVTTATFIPYLLPTFVDVCKRAYSFYEMMAEMSHK